MLKIERVTDCKVLIKCQNFDRNPDLAAVWREGEMNLKLCSGSTSVIITKSQLLQLCEIAPQIASDLIPNSPKKEQHGHP